MRMTILVSFLLAAIAPACGGDDPATPDAPPAADAVPQAVRTVSCPNPGGTPDITANLTAFMPASFTTTVGGIVHFSLSGNHTVVSTTAGETFSLPVNANACLRFDAAGTYTFRCSIHGFTGMVVVQ